MELQMELKEKEEKEEAELTFQPQINQKSARRADRSAKREGVDFVDRERLFLAKKEAKRAERKQQKLENEEQEMTFKPRTNENSRLNTRAPSTPKKVG